MLDYSDIRSKVVVLILATSGMRIGALAELKIRHLKKIPEYNLYHITIYENTKDEHYSFCTPECTKAIEEYLEYRKKCGERIINTDAGEAPVIRERFDRIDIATTKKPKHLTQKGMGEILDVLLSKAGLTVTKHSTELQQIRKGSERKDVKRAHGFRKFFNTNLVRAKVNIAIKEKLLGHSIKLDDNYLRLNDDEVLQEYLKAVDYLTINNEHRLQRKVVELTQKQDDIELMKAEQRRKELEFREQMQQQQQQYKRMIEEFQERDRKEKEELQREITGTLEAVRALVTDGNDDSIAKNKAYHLQPEDTETKETLKKAQMRAAKQLRKDTLAQYSRRRRLRSISNRIQQQQQA
jgi:Phage integrase family